MPGIKELQLYPNQQVFVHRFVQACQADERVVAAFLGGSNVKGTKDEFSDIDVCIITSNSSYEEFYNQRQVFLQSLGELVFLEDFGIPNIAFFIFADGTEGELYFGNERRLNQIHSGPFRTLLDKKNILTEAAFPERAPDKSHQLEQLRYLVYGFWHEMSHFITAIGRNQLWWARGQLDELRAICVNLARLESNFSDDGVGGEPYFKIENAMDVKKLSPLTSTFCTMEKEAMLSSAHIIVQFYKRISQSLVQMHRIAYPQNLESVMLQRLEKVSAA
jgi:hypothetical protein